MKGVKCHSQVKIPSNTNGKRSLGLFRRLIVLSVCVVISLTSTLFISFSNASALNVSYTQFGVYTSNFNDGCSNYYYGEGIAFNTRYYMCNMRSFLAESNAVSSTGNYVTLYGKINIVASKWLAESGTYLGTFTNLNNMHVIAVGQKDVPNGSIEVVSSDLQYYVTEWTNNSGDLVETLTVIFSISAKNVVSNINSKIRVLIGNDTLPIYQTSNNLSSYYYFEPTDTPFMINFQNNSQDSLLQLQINQNQQMLAQDQQDRDDLQNAADDAESSTNSSATSINNSSQNLITIISNFVNVLAHPPASNCVIDADMGHMDLGNVDLCQLSVPQPIAIIATLIMVGATIPVVISLIRLFLELLWRFTG